MEQLKLIGTDELNLSTTYEKGNFSKSTLSKGSDTNSETTQAIRQFEITSKDKH